MQYMYNMMIIYIYNYNIYIYNTYRYMYIPYKNVHDISSYLFSYPLLPISSSHLGRPTMEGKTVRGASSPAKPALHMPLPLSTTSALDESHHALETAMYSSAYIIYLYRYYKYRYWIVDIRS